MTSIVTTLMLLGGSAWGADSEATPSDDQGSTFAAVRARGNDCALGFIAWCVIESKQYGQFRQAPTRTRPFRIEAFGAYKPSNLYYRAEQDGCDTAGCTLDFRGPSFGLNASIPVSGDSYTDEYMEISLHVSYMPVIGQFHDNDGFEGAQGRIEPGMGYAGYTNVRVSLRRPHFLYLIRSKYLISTFGVGVSIPTTSGAAGTSFTGMNGPKLNIGGKLGAQWPLSPRFAIGLVDNWTVVWWGRRFVDSAFQSAYGLHLAVQI